MSNIIKFPGPVGIDVEAALKDWEEECARHRQDIEYWKNLKTKALEPEEAPEEADGGLILQRREYMRRFYIIPEGVSDMCVRGQLSSTAVLLYGRLLRQWNSSKSGWLEPTDAELTKITGLSTRQVKRSLRALLECKLLLVMREKGKRNRYAPLHHPAVEVAARPRYHRPRKAAKKDDAED